MRRVILPEGFNRSYESMLRPPLKPRIPIRVTEIDQLKALINDGWSIDRESWLCIIYIGYRVQDLDVRGNTTDGIDPSLVHPVVKAIYDRLESKSVPGNRTDGILYAQFIYQW